MFRRNLLLSGLVIISLLAVLLLAACSSPAPDPAPVAPPIEVEKPVDTTAATADWQASEHNNMEFLMATGTNSYCARCHSPRNWDPDALKSGPAGGCFNHHGPGAAPGWNTKTLGNEAILEEDLAVIDCGICHDGGTGPDIAIWNNVSKGYDAVATADELCQKCHGPAWGGFEAATSPSDKAGDKGTATDGTATSLTETGQDFLTTVAVGMTVFNETDNSLATVTAVNDDESITTTALIGRATRPESKIVTELTWETDDKYHI